MASPIMVTLISVMPATLWCKDSEAEVRSTIEAFYKAFDDGFTQPADFATEDWNHVNPFGGRTRGREATLQEVREAHRTFLKGTTEFISDWLVAELPLWADGSSFFCDAKSNFFLGNHG